MRNLLIMALMASPIFATIEDGAKLFSPEAVAAAEKKLEEIKSLTKKDIIVYTTPEILGKSISETALDIARTRRLNGMIIIISKKPRMLDVIAGRKTAIILTAEHEKKIRDILMQNLGKRPNEALRDSVDYLHRLFKKAEKALILEDQHPEAAAVSTQSTSGGSFKWLLLIGGIIFAGVAAGFFLQKSKVQT